MDANQKVQTESGAKIQFTQAFPPNKWPPITRRDLKNLYTS
jgi:hypothetical protein